MRSTRRRMGTSSKHRKDEVLRHENRDLKIHTHEIQKNDMQNIFSIRSRIMKACRGNRDPFPTIARIIITSRDRKMLSTPQAARALLAIDAINTSHKKKPLFPIQLKQELELRSCDDGLDLVHAKHVVNALKDHLQTFINPQSQ